jgi:hypothetical protein
MCRHELERCNKTGRARLRSGLETLFKKEVRYNGVKMRRKSIASTGVGTRYTLSKVNHRFRAVGFSRPGPKSNTVFEQSSNSICMFSASHLMSWPPLLTRVSFRSLFGGAFLSRGGGRCHDMRLVGFFITVPFGKLPRPSNTCKTCVGLRPELCGGMRSDVLARRTVGGVKVDGAAKSSRHCSATYFKRNPHQNS